MLRAPCAVIALGLVAASFAARGQEHAQQPPTFSARSELVVLHVTVEDRKGTYISDLPKEAFTVFDEGRPQDVQFFSATDTPATIGLLIDNSTSMTNKRDMVVAAALGFAQMSNQDDEMFVLAFNEDVNEIWRPQVIAASNPVSLRATLIGGIAARGMTALYDAVSIGLEKLAQGKHVRQVLVIVSDGSDNASNVSLEQILGKMRTADAAIFTVILRDPIGHEGNPKLLKRLASETGGEAFEPESLRDLPDTLKHIARDIRSAYTIGFVPETSLREQQLRKLRVSVRTRDGRTLNARTRGGYVTRGQS